MRIAIVVCCAILAASCQPVRPEPKPLQPLKDTTIYVTRNTPPCDSMVVYQMDTVALKALQRERDSLIQQLYVTRYKLQRVKYYISITERNPNNKVFFFGWIKRAVK